MQEILFSLLQVLVVVMELLDRSIFPLPPN